MIVNEQNANRHRHPLSREALPLRKYEKKSILCEMRLALPKTILALSAGAKLCFLLYHTCSARDAQAET